MKSCQGNCRQGRDLCESPDCWEEVSLSEILPWLFWPFAVVSLVALAAMLW